MNYHIDIYRLGYTPTAAGGRKIATIALPRAAPQVSSQRVSTIRRRACTTREWAVSATWNTASYSGWTRDLRHLCREAHSWTTWSVPRATSFFVCAR